MTSRDAPAVYPMFSLLLAGLLCTSLFAGVCDARGAPSSADRGRYMDGAQNAAVAIGPTPASGRK
jgi:hypothetical protein